MYFIRSGSSLDYVYLKWCFVLPEIALLYCIVFMESGGKLSADLFLIFLLYCFCWSRSFRYTSNLCTHEIIIQVQVLWTV